MRNIVMLGAMLAAGSAIGAPMSSTFDAGDQGWRQVTLTTPFSPTTPDFPGTIVSAPWVSTAGNSGGHLSNYDVINYQYWLTPASWNGNNSDLYGGRVSWDYRWSTTNGVWAGSWADIAVRDTVNNVWLVADVTASALAQNTWYTLGVNLNNTGGWRINNTGGVLATNAQILSALTNFGGFYIRSEVHMNSVETYRLDNFNATIPEPGSALLAGVVGGMGLLRRNRRNRVVSTVIESPVVVSQVPAVQAAPRSMFSPVRRTGSR